MCTNINIKKEKELTIEYSDKIFDGINLTTEMINNILQFNKNNLFIILNAFNKQSIYYIDFINTLNEY